MARLQLPFVLFGGGRPRGASKVKRRALERSESAQKRGEAQGSDQVFPESPSRLRTDILFFLGGLSPRSLRCLGPRASSSSRRLGASKPEGNSASRPLARETGGVLRGPCGALRPGGHAPRGPLASRCEAKSPANSIFPLGLTVQRHSTSSNDLGGIGLGVGR